ncbi:kinase-like protein [Macroventuria anomochaeta]|uniref:Kinase-like protein n=1 Tax=Macroventuria anomochaeta TaxID=301207 RepID=A0ACB6RHJ8_9PLEO|nr:kinase-like protein [Macroventuria anomochaeta]KAF2621390.1 kinase-like protein [Macroventuria anomochaeta]
MTENTFHTAVSGYGERAAPKPYVLQETDDYAKLLQSKELWPVDVSVEQDWSGRGQHVEFEDTEQARDEINRILKFQRSLGTQSTATVQSVKCRRVLLARKSIICSKRHITRSEAIDEVVHLTQLRHAHILRVIGTYVIGKELSILLYPVAEYNLESFLDILHEHVKQTGTAEAYSESHIFDMMTACRQFPLCLANGIAYMHSKFTKHMDIKPQNLLIKLHPQHADTYRIYVADFGISRSYRDLDASNTDGPTSFTFKYAAPEVVAQEERGLAADIFSLGCVYYEILEALLSVTGINHRSFQLQPDTGSVSYQSNIELLHGYLASMSSWLDDFPISGVLPHITDTELLEVLRQMLHWDPTKRPSAAKISSVLSSIWPLGPDSCCSEGQVQLEAHVSGWSLYGPKMFTDLEAED